MKKERPVKFLTLGNLFLMEAKNPLAISGMIVMLLSFILWTPLFAIRFWIQEPYERYDISTIEKEGVRTEAIISAIKTLDQIRIFGKSPKVISYNFTYQDQPSSDQFQTLEELEFSIGDKIRIKVHENQSIIEGIQPFRIPFHLLHIIPLFYLIIGSSLFLAGLRPFFKKYSLYRKGIVNEAAIISIYPQPVLLPHQRFWINYSYKGISGQELYGKSKTNKVNLLSNSGKTMILVSQENEKISCLIPKSEALRNNWKVWE